MSGRETLAVVLIVVGLLMLASNLGLITWGVWEVVGRLWPLLLVAFGFSLALRGLGVAPRARRWTTAIVLLAVAAAFAFAFSRGPEGRPWGTGEVRTKTFEVPAGAYSPDLVRLEVSLGSSRLAISESDRPGFLVTRASYYEAEDEPRLSERMAGRTLVLEYAKSGGPWFRFAFPRPRDSHEIELGRYDAPTEIEIDMGSGEGAVSLGRTRVLDVNMKVGSGKLSYAATQPASEPCDRLSFDVGSGRMDVTSLGDLGPREVIGEVGSGRVRLDLHGAWAVGQAALRLDVGSGDLEIAMPEYVGFTVESRVGSGDVYIDGRRYQGRDLEYSERFDSARVRLRIVADVGSGSLRIRTAGEGERTDV